MDVGRCCRRSFSPQSVVPRCNGAELGNWHVLSSCQIYLLSSPEPGGRRDNLQHQPCWPETPQGRDLSGISQAPGMGAGAAETLSVQSLDTANLPFAGP